MKLYYFLKKGEIMSVKSKRNSMIRKSVLKNGHYGEVISWSFLAFLVLAYFLRILRMDWYTPTIGMGLIIVIDGIYLIKVGLKIRKVNKIIADKKSSILDEVKIPDAIFELFNTLNENKVVLINVSDSSQFVKIDEGVYIN